MNCGALFALLTLINNHQPVSWNFITLCWPKGFHANVCLLKKPPAQHSPRHSMNRFVTVSSPHCQIYSSSRTTSLSLALLECPWRVRKDSGICPMQQFIILIIVLNLEDDQWEDLRVSSPTVPYCCAEMITLPRNALLHTGTWDCHSGDGWQGMDKGSQFIWLCTKKTYGYGWNST